MEPLSRGVSTKEVQLPAGVMIQTFHCVVYQRLGWGWGTICTKNPDIAKIRLTQESRSQDLIINLYCAGTIQTDKFAAFNGLPVARRP